MLVVQPLRFLLVLLLLSGFAGTRAAAAADDQTSSQLAPRLDSYGDPLPKHALLRLGTVRLWQPGPISFLAYGQSGKTLLSLGATPMLRTWNAETGKLLQRYVVAADAGLVVLSPDGRYLAVSTGPHLLVLDAGTGEQVAGWAVRALAVHFTIDTDGIAAITPEGTVRRWSLATGKEIATGQLPLPAVAGVKQGLLCAAFAPDGKRVAGVVRHEEKAAESGTVIRVWDIATGKQRLELRGHQDKVVVLLFSPNSQRLISGTLFDSTLRVWDAATGKVLHALAEPATERVQKGLFKQRLAFAPNGLLLAATRPGLGGKVFLWDTDSGKVHKTLQVPVKESVSALAFHPDGKRLAIGQADGTMSVLDLVTGKTVVPAGDARLNSVGPVLFAPDGKTLFVGQDGITVQRAVATGKVVRSFKGLFPYALSSKATYLVVFADDVPVPDREPAECDGGKPLRGAGLRVFSVLTGKELWRTSVAGYFRWEAFIVFYQRTGKDVLVVVVPGTQLLDMETGMPVDVLGQWRARREAGAFLQETLMGCSPNLKYAVTCDSKTFSVREWGTGRFLGHLAGTDPARFDLRFVFSSDDDFLAVNSSVFRIGTVDSKLLWTTTPSYYPYDYPFPSLLRFSPDSRFLLLPAEAGWQLWNVNGGKYQHGWEDIELAPRSYPVFSSDGHVLAQLDEDLRTIVLRETLTGRALVRLVGHRDDVTNLCFGPEGRTLASTSLDGTLLLWDVTGLATDAGQLPALMWTTADQEKMWVDLASADAPRAFAAQWKLVAAANTTVDLLRQKVSAAVPNPQHVAALLADLDSTKYATREAATRQLEALDGSQPALRKILEGKPTLEVRLRAKRILAKLGEPATNPVLLRHFRAVMVLEQIGTTEARQLLHELATGSPETHLTQAARAALKRLSAKP
jgi:WD40 repeat protein